MRILNFAIVVTAITLLIPTCGMAKGSDMHTRLSHASATTTSSEASPNPTCGTHRHYDPEKQKCRGSVRF